MNKEISEFLRKILKPPYVVLMSCVFMFLSATAEMTRLERQAVPAIAELKGNVPKGYGIESFQREYMADPFGKAIGLSERQLQLCRKLSAYVPAYEHSFRWRNAALLAGILTLLHLAYKRYGSKLAVKIAELKRHLSKTGLQAFLRKMIGTILDRTRQAQVNPAPMKQAVVYRIHRCPSCHQELRVPSGKGRIRITCASCGNKFEVIT